MSPLVLQIHTKSAHTYTYTNQVQDDRGDVFEIPLGDYISSKASFSLHSTPTVMETKP